MKKTIILLFLTTATLFSFNSFAKEININIKANCEFNEKIPKKPINFNKYYPLSDYNDNVEKYNKNLTTYKECVSDFINEVNRSIDKLETEGNKEVRKAQKIEYIEYIVKD